MSEDIDAKRVAKKADEISGALEAEGFSHLEIVAITSGCLGWSLTRLSWGARLQALAKHIEGLACLGLGDLIVPPPGRRR